MARGVSPGAKSTLVTSVSVQIVSLSGCAALTSCSSSRGLERRPRITSGVPALSCIVVFGPSTLSGTSTTPSGLSAWVRA